MSCFAGVIILVENEEFFQLKICTINTLFNYILFLFVLKLAITTGKHINKWLCMQVRSRMAVSK